MNTPPTETAPMGTASNRIAPMGTAPTETGSIESAPTSEPVDLTEYRDQLFEIGIAAGLAKIAVTSADPFDDARENLESRKAEGLNATMQFTYRNPARSTDPRRTMPEAMSLIVGARSYPPDSVEHPGTGPHGRVARVAVDDHYGALRDGLEAIAVRLRDDGWKAMVLADSNSLVDRAVAHRAGLGWFGKNANILVPGLGSWVVLGSVLTEAPLPVTDSQVRDGCGTCTRCIDACPTGAIIAPGVVDARRCLSWLVQADGDFPEEHREALGHRLYGCDDCQEVCPPNLAVSRRSEPDPRARAEAAWVDVLDLLDADDETLLDRHGRWYIAKRDPRYLRRNALVVLGNVGDLGDERTARVLAGYLDHDDDMLVRHARWALVHLESRGRGATGGS